MTMSLLNIVGGGLLIAFGRRLFWFFVAATGFFVSFELASRYLHIQPVWITWLISLGVGLLGALLASFFQKLAIALAGFFAGTYIASRLAPQLAVQLKGWEWLAILLGGILGIVLMAMLFEWGLILLSSLAGAILVVDGFNLSGLTGLLVGLVLFTMGLVYQAGLNRRERSRNKTGNSA